MLKALVPFLIPKSRDMNNATNKIAGYAIPMLEAKESKGTAAMAIEAKNDTGIKIAATKNIERVLF